MAIDKAQCGSTSGITGALGIAGKTITSVTTFRLGSVEVVDILCTDTVHYYVKTCTDTVHYYVKTRQGQVEAGGTCEWGSGTQAGGR